MTIRVIDTETTGKDPMTDKVVEIASLDIVMAPGSGYQITNIQQDLVNPGIPIPAQASAVHHIIDADVADMPSLCAVMEKYAHCPDSKRLVCVAHNCAFDRGFLDGQFDACEQEVEWVCTYKAALRVWPDLPSHSNQFLRYYFGHVEPFGIARETIAAHRAISDCYVTAAVFIELLKKAHFRDLLTWTNEPALYSRFSFGKHKGKRYDECPADYLDWIVNKSDMDADTKFSARYWMDKPKAAA